MNEFEKKLRDALTRAEPPDGFAERLMARIPERPRVGVRRSPMCLPGWMPAAAAVLIGTFGAASYEYLKAQKQRHEAEQARRELIYALQVTKVKLSTTFARLSAGKKGGM